jgi:hypothetical protein
VNAPTALSALPWAFPVLRGGAGVTRVRVLAGTGGRVDVTRVDARTLLVDVAPDARPDPVGALFRDRPLAVGEAHAVPGMRAEVLRLKSDLSPASVRFTFDRDLDDPSFRWVGWSGAFADVALPRVGERVSIGQ